MAGPQQAATAMLELLAGYGGEKPFELRLAAIDPAYTTGLAKVTFEGETAVSGKGYAWVRPYVPQPNDRVVMAPVGTSYLILGPVTSTASGDFRISGTASGLIMQSPNGTYWRLSPSNSGASVWTTV